MYGKRKQPDWLVEAMGKDKQDIPDQMTIIAMGPSGQPQGGSGYQAEYTGTGDNGTVEPNQPTDMVMTDRGPRMIHEGELQIVGPGGRMTVIPADEVARISGQDILSKMEMDSAQMQATDIGNEPIGGYGCGTGKINGYQEGTGSIRDNMASGMRSVRPSTSINKPEQGETKVSGPSSRVSPAPSRQPLDVSASGTPATGNISGDVSLGVNDVINPQVRTTSPGAVAGSAIGGGLSIGADELISTPTKTASASPVNGSAVGDGLSIGVDEIIAPSQQAATPGSVGGDATEALAISKDLIDTTGKSSQFGGLTAEYADYAAKNPNIDFDQQGFQSHLAAQGNVSPVDMARDWFAQNPNATGEDLATYMQSQGYVAAPDGTWQKAEADVGDETIATGAADIAKGYFVDNPEGTVEGLQAYMRERGYVAAPDGTWQKAEADVGDETIATDGGRRDDVNAALDRLVNVMNGESPVDQAIMQRYLTEMRAGNAADRKALLQKMSTDPSLTDGAKAAALGELQRGQYAAEGEMMSDLSIDAMNRAENAARDVINKGMDVEKFDRRLADEDWARALMYYDPSTPDGLKTLQDMYVDKFGGSPPDLNVLQEERSYAQRKREQDITMGDQAITAGDLGITDKQNGIIRDMVSQGYSREDINAELRRMKSTRSITEDELNNMRDTTNYGMWKAEFDENNSRYQDNKDWQEYNAALARSDWGGAKAAWMKLNPNSPEPSMQQLIRDQQFVNDKNDILLDGMRNDLGDEKFNSVQARVDAGLPWSKELEDTYGVSEEAYNAMYDASPLGERDHTRRIDAAKILLETPGEGNKVAAAGMLNEAFPGMDIDFTQVISDENAQYFTTGMGEMAQYIAGTKSTETWDKVPESKRKEWAKTMGLDKNEAGLMYESMRISETDAMWTNFQNSAMWNEMEPEQQEAWEAIQIASQTGEVLIDYSETGRYLVRDAERNIVGTYDTEEAANEAARGIVDASVEAEMDISFKDPTTNININNGDPNETYIPPSPGITVVNDAGETKTFDTQEEADAFIEKNDGYRVKDTGTATTTAEIGTLFYDPNDGKYYRKLGENKRSKDSIEVDVASLKDDADYAWNEDMQDIIDIGEGDHNPYYDKVLKARVDSILKKKRGYTDLKGPGDPVFDAVMDQAPNWREQGYENNKRTYFTDEPENGTYFEQDGQLYYKIRDSSWNDEGDSGDSKAIDVKVFNPATNQWESRRITAQSRLGEVEALNQRVNDTNQMLTSIVTNATGDNVGRELPSYDNVRTALDALYPDERSLASAAQTWMAENPGKTQQDFYFHLVDSYSAKVAQETKDRMDAS